MEIDEEMSAGGTPEDLRALMQALGLTQTALSRLVCVDKGAPGRWLSGAVPVPPWLIVHLGLLGALRTLSPHTASEASEPRPLPARLEHFTLIGNKSSSNMRLEGTSDAMMNNMQALQKPMSADDFRQALAAIRWKQADFSRRAGVSLSATNRWAQAKAPIPNWVAVHLSLLARIEAIHAEFVPP